MTDFSINVNSQPEEPRTGASQALSAFKTHNNFRKYLQHNDLIYVSRGFSDEVSNEGLENALGLSGDFITCLPHDNSNFSVLVGDVCGHDTDAIYQSIEIQRYLTSTEFLDEVRDISFLEAIDKLQEKFESYRNFALSWVKIDLEKKIIQSFSAGALMPIIIRKNGKVEQSVNYLNPTPLGFPYMEEHLIENSENTCLKTGDMIAIVTDGLIDSIIGKNGIGRDNLISELIASSSLSTLSPFDIYSLIFSEVDEEKEINDDLSLAVFRV